MTVSAIIKVASRFTRSETWVALVKFGYSLFARTKYRTGGRNFVLNMESPTKIPKDAEWEVANFRVGADPRMIAESPRCLFTSAEAFFTRKTNSP